MGSLTVDGTEITPSSGANSLVQVWRRGEHVLYRVKQGTNDGIDVNNDGEIEIPGTLLSQGSGIGARFHGQTLDRVITAVPDTELSRLYSRETPAGQQALRELLDKDKVYKTADLIKYFKIEQQPMGKALLKRGDYVTWDFNFSFKIGPNGLVAFDPSGKGHANQVMLVSGTSFSAPSICLQ